MRRTATWRPMPPWCSPRMPARNRANSPKRLRKSFAPTIWSARSRSRVQASSISRSSLPPGSRRCAMRSSRVRITARATSAAARRSMSNMSRQIPPDRCISAIAAAPCSATRWRTCSPSPALAVTREYYVNDAGAQVDVLARSAYLRYREALGEDIGAIPEGLYPGDYLKPVGAALAAEFGDALTRSREAEWLPVVRAKAIEMMMAAIRADLAALNVTHDIFYSERSLVDRRVPIASPKRSIGCAREATSMKAGCRRRRARRSRTGRTASRRLFRSTAFGDDVDRPLKKSDGSYTYFASDIAYHRTQARARLSHADRRLGRRPRRLHQAHAGGGGGAERAKGRA